MFFVKNQDIIIIIINIISTYLNLSPLSNYISTEYIIPKKKKKLESDLNLMLIII